MHPILYRAWHKKRKFMGHVDMINMLNGYASVNLDNDPESSCVGKTDMFHYKESVFGGEEIEIVLMRGTSWLTKDKVVIFEGDIVNYDVPLEYEKHLAVSGVIWCAVRDGWKLSRYSAPGYYGSRMQIIGNIYESPELVERYNL